jgi:predicted PurR-regulated permease PerM
MRTMKIHWSLIIFFAALIILFVLIFTLRSALLPFIIGVALAYVLLPVIRWAENKVPVIKNHYKLRRSLMIASIYLGFLVLTGLFLFFTFVSVRPAITELVSNSTNYYNSTYDKVIQVSEKLTDPIFAQFPPDVHTRIDKFIYDTGLNALNSLTKNIGSGSSSLPVSAISTFFGLAVMPVFLFYMLKDWEKLKLSFYSGLPGWARPHTKQMFTIIDQVLGSFIRAQLTLGALVGTTTLIVLLILKVPFAWVLGPLAGLLEMVPTFGPWISAIAAILVTIATAPDKILLVGGVYGAVQLIENLFVIPRIQGGFLRIHPGISILLLVVGSYVAGLWGVLIILPLTATLKELYLYTRSVIRESQTKTITAQLESQVEEQPFSQPVGQNGEEALRDETP